MRLGFELITPAFRISFLGRNLQIAKWALIHAQLATGYEIRRADRIFRRMQFPSIAGGANRQNSIRSVVMANSVVRANQGIGHCRLASESKHHH
jgi:hypothetical protein